MTLLITINNTKTINININDDNSGQVRPPPPPPSLANASGGVSDAILGDYRQQEQCLGSDNDDDSLPRVYASWRVALGNDDDGSPLHHPLPHCKHERGGSVVIFWATTATTTPSLTVNVSGGVSYSFLGDNSHYHPFPHCKREDGAHQTTRDYDNDEG